MKLLVAESDSSLARTFSECLSQVGFTVETATDAVECQAKCCDFQPDVLLLGMELPTGNGEDAWQQLRSINASIILTTNRTGEFGDDDPRVFACHPKPFAISQLLETLELLRHARTEAVAV